MGQRNGAILPTSQIVAPSYFAGGFLCLGLFVCSKEGFHRGFLNNQGCSSLPTFSCLFPYVKVLGNVSAGLEPFLVSFNSILFYSVL